ncbi:MULTISPECIES: Flp family type IVb pilin [unclassified Dietzia]|uniref:Flp family type IVb pilin n=1 Tax=unclassified Dietzia TaxID=2617939 RepID=UPI0015F7DD0E|nr:MULTISPECIES: Flp family type IVb pilin [unclassified Dietzia]MBB1024484.1 Flp family type IVb pilin [Dietzia sp. DQ12-76]MBB1028568.1 Flp family type IVb pilin [Dietzia sp. DQ11-38-2]
MSQVAAYYFTLYALVSDRFEDRKDRGATAVEYGLMVGLIAVAIIAAVILLGGNLNTLFENIAGRLPSGAANAPAAT